jgi:hypothetical protein
MFGAPDIFNGISKYCGFLTMNIYWELFDSYNFLGIVSSYSWWVRTSTKSTLPTRHPVRYLSGNVGKSSPIAL